MTALMGPADADHFRIKVGRWGDRWYTDPLPTCPIAKASDWQGPSVSATKPPFANKYVPMRAIADMTSDQWRQLADKPADDRYEAIKTHDKAVARVNMNRGSIIHLWAENLLLGKPVQPATWGTSQAEEQAVRFLPALHAFFDTYQPELVAAEVVCLHRTLNDVGYGGTSDAIIRIEGDVWCVDYKSRLSDHAAYPDEAGQGGAYIGAEYMIVTGPDGNPCRAPIPKVAGVLIVSIREDGFRAYPIDAGGAIRHYEQMHAWWCAQQQLTASKVIGRPWAPKSAAGTQAGEASSSISGSNPSPPRPLTEPDRRTLLLARYQTMSDNEKLEYMAIAINIDRNNLDAIETALNQIDRFNVHVDPVLPEPVEPVELEQPPDEGGTVSDDDCYALNLRYDNLDIEAQLWTGKLVAEARNSHTFRIKDKPTVRRFELYRGILALAEWGNGHDQLDDIVTAIVATVWEAPLTNDTPAGQLLGTLNHEQATQFAQIAADLTQDRYSLTYEADGTPRLTIGVEVTA